MSRKSEKNAFSGKVVMATGHCNEYGADAVGIIHFAVFTFLVAFSAFTM